jgi:hypothetical protein
VPLKKRGKVSAKPLEVPWLIRLFWDEMVTLLVCVSLDVIEYIFPLLMIPVAGDLIDIIGLAFCTYFFNWIGLISVLELIPGLDALPIFTATWLIWYVLKRRKARMTQGDELESWR